MLFKTCIAAAVSLTYWSLLYDNHNILYILICFSRNVIVPKPIVEPLEDKIIFHF